MQKSDIIMIDARWVTIVLSGLFIWFAVEIALPYVQDAIRNKAEKTDLNRLSEQLGRLTVTIESNAKDISEKLFAIQQELAEFRNSESELRRRIGALEDRQEDLARDNREILKATLNGRLPLP